GTDTAFLGGLINYALEKGHYNKDYLVNYTNAPFIIKDGFKLPEDGLYSGFNPATQVYDKSTWNYEQGGNMTGQGAAGETPKTRGAGGRGRRLQFSTGRVCPRRFRAGGGAPRRGARPKPRPPPPLRRPLQRLPRRLLLGPQHRLRRRRLFRRMLLT